MRSALRGGMLTLAWIPWPLTHHEDLLVTNAPARRTLTIGPVLSSEKCPIMLCAALIQLSYWIITDGISED